jgi:hypothetical protein
VNPSSDEPEKEAVVPKEFETSKEEDVAVGPQGRGYVQAWQFGVFHPTEVAHRVFPPPTYQGFSSCKFISFPCVRSSLRVPYRIRIRR